MCSATSESSMELRPLSFEGREDRRLAMPLEFLKPDMLCEDGFRVCVCVFFLSCGGVEVQAAVVAFCFLT